MFTSLTSFVLGDFSAITIGPTAILALLIQRYVAENADFAVFIAFMNGTLIFLFGLLNLGFLVQFISTPVNRRSSYSDFTGVYLRKNCLISGDCWIHISCSHYDRK